MPRVLDAPVFGSLLTRPYRLATRGAELTIRTTRQAIDLAGEVVTAVALRVIGGSENGHEPDMTPATQMPPDTRTPDMSSGPDAPPTQEARPSTEEPPAPESPSAEQTLNAEKPSSTPEPPSAARRLAAETRDVPPAPPAETRDVPPAPPIPAEPDPIPAEPDHVSEEPELVEEFAEPGAEDGAGAQLRIAEPWQGYDEMKAADIIARLASASREELAAVELYELAGRDRKSVVAAAQRALKRASPPG